jgi:hypothetical protein
MNRLQNYEYIKRETDALTEHDRSMFPHFYNKELLLELSDDEQKTLKEERFEHKKKLANAFRMIKEIINLSHLDWEQDLHRAVEEHIQMYEESKNDPTLLPYRPRFFENIERCLIKFWYKNWWLTLDYSNILPYLAEYWDEILYEHIGVFGKLSKEIIKKIVNTTLSIHNSPESENKWIGWVAPANIHKFEGINDFTKEDFEELADNIIETVGVWELVYNIHNFQKLDEWYHKKILNFVLHDQYHSEWNDYSDIWCIIKNIKEMKWLDHNDYIQIIQKAIKNKESAMLLDHINDFPREVVKETILPLTKALIREVKDVHLVLLLWEVEGLEKDDYIKIADMLYNNGRWKETKTYIENLEKNKKTLELVYHVFTNLLKDKLIIEDDWDLKEWFLDNYKKEDQEAIKNWIERKIDAIQK